MKKIYSLFILLSGSILFAQEYQTLLNPQNRWLVWSLSNPGDGGNPVDTEYKIQTTPTIIDNKEYYGVDYRWKISFASEESWSEWMFSLIYIREDVESKKVYKYNTGEEEKLLYDFNLNIGDSVPTDSFEPYYHDHGNHVTSISYETVFGITNVKTFHTDIDDFKIYEGIGSSYGLFTYNEFEESFNLVNFYRSTMSTSEENLKSKILIYPNPFSDKIQIQNSEEIKELQLFDLQGKLISENKNLDELNSKLSSLNNAVYFLRITFKNNKSETIKLIKNK